MLSSVEPEGTFTTNGVVDEETQKNDLDIVREIVKVTKAVSIERLLQLCQKSGQRADPSGLETLETPADGALRVSARRGRNLMILAIAPPI